MTELALLPHQQSNRPLDLPYTTFQHLLKSKMKENPEKTFLIFPESDRSYTYREFHHLTLVTASWLRPHAQFGRTICILFRNTPEFLAVFFGAAALGMTVVPINPDLAAPEIGFIIQNSGCRSVCYDPDMRGKVASLEAGLPEVSFFTLANADDLPPVDAGSIEASLPRVDPTMPAAIIYTSGTTGYPKGVILSHMNFLVDGRGMAQWFQFSPETRSLCILPLFHNNGLVVSLTTTLQAGGSIVMVDPKASLRSFWALVSRYKATNTSVMPSILAAILAFGFDGRPGTLKGIICGGQLLPLNLARQFEARFSIPIFEGFGSTEAASYSCFNPLPAENRKLGSVGKVLPVCEMKVVDESDNEVSDGIEGELCIRGANVAIGYHNLPELQATRFRNGWYHSGDYGMRDGDGYYYFRGREDDLIVKGGEKIYPAEIENVLATHPAVSECAVIGVEDAILGQEICAFAKLADSANVSEADLLQHCAESLARFKQPKRVVILNRLSDMREFPKGPTKKILYRELREDYYRRLANAADPEALKWVLGV